MNVYFYEQNTSHDVVMFIYFYQMYCTYVCINKSLEKYEKITFICTYFDIVLPVTGPNEYCFVLKRGRVKIGKND